MNLMQARQMALDLMGEYDLTPQGWRFKFDSAVKRLGLCSYRTKTISISKAITALNPEEQVRNTILHEIAHALVGSSNGHNNVWRNKAIEIGCNGERTTSPIVRVQASYKIVCLVCQGSWLVFRKPKGLMVSYHKRCGSMSMGKLRMVTI